MKNLLLCLIMIFTIQNAFSQDNEVINDPDEIYMENLRKGMMGVEYIDPFSGYDGDHYYNDWTYGEIILANGEKITGLLLRYERFQDQLLWLREDYTTCILCKTCINGFNLFNDSNNVFASFTLKKGIRLPLENDSANCFFHTLVEGDYSFYAFRRVGRLPDAFKLVDNTRYYIFDNDQYVRVKLNLHDLLSVSFIDKTRMKSIIKTNRIRLRNNEQEFIRAISIYNM